MAPTGPGPEMCWGSPRPPPVQGLPQGAARAPAPHGKLIGDWTQSQHFAFGWTLPCQGTKNSEPWEVHVAQPSGQPSGWECQSGKRT